nr:MAG TPA: tail length tape measure protein [Caudoviricetes sp.]
MSDIASLIVRVTTQGVDNASGALRGLGKAALAAGAAVGGLAAAKEVFSSLVESQRNFDKLNAGLITMTGSTENAAKAFGVLQQFAKDTPYGLNQAVEGFTKLVALGLKPSQEALVSYGNTAAAMGKDLNQMIEAVADASTGEFERLKEFGIKSSKQGNDIAFTFQGVTTNVKNNSEAIQEYLLAIGNTQFAGAMEQRAKTLDGAISSLEDSFEAFKLSVAQSGFGDLVAEQVRNAETAINEMTGLIASGQLSAEISAWTDLFDNSFSFISDWLNDLNKDFNNTAKAISPFGNTIATDISDGIAALPPYVAAIMKEVYYEFDALVKKAGAVGVAVANALNPFSESGFSDTYAAESKEIERALAARIKIVHKERDDTIQAFKDQVEASKKLRKEYDDRAKQQADLADLVKNKPGSPSAQPDPDAAKAAKKAADEAKRNRELAQDFLDTLARQQQDELKAIDAQEQQKLDKLNKFRELRALSDKQYEDAKTQIMLEADTARQEELDKREKERKEKQQKGEDFMAQILGQNAVELDLLEIQEKQKYDIAQQYREQGLISEDQYQASLVAIAGNYNKKRRTEYANMLGQTTDDLRTALGEGNKMYKAFAIANAIMNTYQGAVAAFQSAAAIPIVGWIAAPVAAAAAVAAGLANVAKIRSAREQGGNLAAGQISTIAERGRAEVIMPAGASRVRTAAQMRQIMGEDNKRSGNDSVVIVNNTTGRIDSATTERDDEGRLRVIISETVSRALQDSNSDISKSRRNTRGLPGY